MWSYQEYHKSLEGCERVISGADARFRNALVTFKEVSDTDETDSLGETDSENHHIGVHGAEKNYAMPRFHSSSVWFFLLEHRETGMAIATDVDGRDWRALLLIPAPLAPLKVGLM